MPKKPRVKDKTELKKAKEATENGQSTIMSEQEMERVLKSQRSSGETVERMLTELQMDYRPARRK